MITARFNVRVKSIVGDTLVGDNALIELAAIVDGAGLGFVVNADETKACRLALAPLKVVHKAPVVVSLDGVVRLADKL